MHRFENKFYVMKGSVDKGSSDQTIFVLMVTWQELLSIWVL